MPADLGTKAVGPARLEDLIKICDLWVPNGRVSTSPPRPQVASLKAGQTDVAKALLALLLLIQVSGAKAEQLSLQVDDLQLLWHSFVIGFGLGCGWWVAGRLGAMISGCFRRPPVSIGPRTPRIQSSESRGLSQHGQPALRDYEEILEPGEPDPFPVQSEGAEPGISPGAEEALRLLYEHLCQEQAEENAREREARGSLQVDHGLWGSSEGSDRTGSPEVRLPGDLEQREAGERDFRAEIAEPAYEQRTRGQPPAEMLANARAPTVPMPPEHPYLGPQRNQAVYVDDVVEIDSGSEESSIRQRTTDSGMPRGPSSGSQRSQGSQLSGRSLVAASLAASVHSAAGYREALQEENFAWEFWLFVIVLAGCCSALGVLGTCVWFRSREGSGPRDSLSRNRETGEGSSETSGIPESEAGTLRRRRVDAVQFSPTVNIADNTEAVDVGWRIAERQRDCGNGNQGQGSDSGEGQVRMQRSPIGSPCGLVSPRTLEDEPGKGPYNPVGSPSGLVLHRTLEDGPGKGPNDPVGSPSGLVSTRTLKEEAGKALHSPVGPPVVLGPRMSQGVEDDQVTKGASSSGAEGSAFRDQRGAELVGDVGNTVRLSERIPEDKMRRPWNLKKHIIMSSQVQGQRTVVYVTQNGECVHSATNCRAMQYATAPIARNLCPFCIEGERLPARRAQNDGEDPVSVFTKSGQCIHMSRRCQAIARDEEVLARRLCRCCRWG